MGGAAVCAHCGGPFGVRSNVVDRKLFCDKCAAAAGATLSGDSHAVFVRSLVFGVGAALVGLAFYATFTIVTHMYLGYVALAVGWLVGKAMMAGSKGVGGQRYQIAAVILTYAAISLASVPIIITRAIQHGAGASTDIDWTAVVGRLVVWGIASPFLEVGAGISGIIGLVILFVGLRIAYRMTAAQRRTAPVRP